MADDEQDDWSDGSAKPAQTTTATLGFSDGPITNSADLVNPQTSRLGGRPSFLPTLPSCPSIDSSHCTNCSLPMELLVQLYAPLEGSVDDRVLYVFGCAKLACQGKGSVRAFSSARRNEKYARAHEKRALKKKQAASQPAAAPAVVPSNPFASFGGGSAAFNPFATSSANPFQTTASNPFGPAPVVEERSVEEPSGLTESLDDLSLDVPSEPFTFDPGWKEGPEYAPLYLSTQPEYFPPAQSVPAPTPVRTEDAQVASADGKEWDELKEDRADGTLEAFLERLNLDPHQVIRYDPQGQPLLSSSSSPLYALLKRGGRGVPRCERCKGKREFEMQLVPNLLNVLKREEGGMEWAQVGVWTCRTLEGGCERAAWREEWVGVEWDV